MRVHLRPATLDDMRMVFKWRNDPFLVARGSSRLTVSWEVHQRWFTETINGDSRKMFIVQGDEQPIGQVRFDRINQGGCVITAYLLKEFTGKGYGVEAIRGGCLEIHKMWAVQRVIACVRMDNRHARSAFMKALFLEEDHQEKYCAADHFQLCLTFDKSG